MVAQAVATIALGLLGASGVAKLTDPEPTTGAMGTAGLPSSNTLSRLLGSVEIAGAVLALALGGLAVMPAALLYATFAVFTTLALRRKIPLQSCGCFGREDTPPTWLHVGYNVVSALALGALALGGAPALEWGMPPLDLAIYLAFGAIGVYASFLLLTRLPQLLDTARAS